MGLSSVQTVHPFELRNPSMDQNCSREDFSRRTADLWNESLAEGKWKQQQKEVERNENTGKMAVHKPARKATGKLLAKGSSLLLAGKSRSKTTNWFASFLHSKRGWVDFWSLIASPIASPTAFQSKMHRHVYGSVWERHTGKVSAKFSACDLATRARRWHKERGIREMCVRTWTPGKIFEHFSRLTISLPIENLSGLEILTQRDRWDRAARRSAFEESD